jgi:hypothetical protein
MNSSELEKIFSPKFITDIDSDEYAKLLCLPMAQKRCSIYKKYVRVSKDYIIKGPYLLRDKTFRRVLMANKAMKALDDHFETTTFQEIDSIVFYDKEFYIRWRLIGDYDSMELYEGSTKVDKYGIYVKRNTMNKRVSDIEKDPSLFNQDLAKQIITHLYFRFLLEIGDSGSHNILYDDNQKSVIGIDFDESRKDCTGLTRFKLLFGMHPTLFRERLYENAIANFKYLEDFPQELETYLRRECGYNTNFIKNNIYLYKFVNC